MSVCPGEISRRVLLAAGVALVAVPRGPVARAASGVSLPVRLPGREPGDGLVIRHGYCTENTWYNPGWWHTGEDWYTTDGDAAGVPVVAIAPGTVVFAGSEYPGRVVIVEHEVPEGALYSMYGHLDPDLRVAAGDRVDTGAELGVILRRTDGRAPSHLHVEVRTFLTRTDVNGSDPRYGVGCGYECPPGPGYWPIDAPEHPSTLGWRNPTHVIANRAFDGAPPDGAEVIVASGAGGPAALWTLPSDRRDAERIGKLPLEAGERYRLLGVATGPEATEAASAEGYRLWYRIAVPGAGEAWVRAALPWANDTGADGRPSSVRFDFLPVSSPR